MNIEQWYAKGFDEGVESVWNEVVCSVCGSNHDRDESAACDDCEPELFMDWVERQRREQRDA